MLIWNDLKYLYIGPSWTMYLYNNSTLNKMTNEFMFFNEEFPNSYLLY